MHLHMGQATSSCLGPDRKNFNLVGCRLHTLLWQYTCYVRCPPSNKALFKGTVSQPQFASLCPRPHPPWPRSSLYGGPAHRLISRAKSPKGRSWLESEEWEGLATDMTGELFGRVSLGVSRYSSLTYRQSLFSSPLCHRSLFNLPSVWIMMPNTLIGPLNSQSPNDSTPGS